MCIPTIYNAKEAAEILKVHPDSVRKWAREGKIKTLENIGRVRITEDEIKRFINGN